MFGHCVTPSCLGEESVESVDSQLRVLHYRHRATDRLLNDQVHSVKVWFTLGKAPPTWRCPSGKATSSNSGAIAGSEQKQTLDGASLALKQSSDKTYA